MEEFHIDVKTPDMLMDCFAARPDQEGELPGVILCMDAPGVGEELQDFASRIAAQGYFCSLPDLC